MMFYSPLNRIDNSPYARWDSSSIQREMDNITTCITDLATRLMNTNTAQTVNGQKTFSDLYFRDQTPTYGTVMDWINHDISPVFGAGGASFSRDGAVEEGRFTKPNVSGVVMDAALKNPIFSMNSISITGGTDYRGKEVLWVNAPNVPLAAYDAQKLGLPPNLNSGNIEPYYWATSKNCSGTVILNTGETLTGGTSRYVGRQNNSLNIVAAYNEVIDKVDLLLVDKEKVKELPSCYKSMSILCQLYTLGVNGYGTEYYNTYTLYRDGEFLFPHRQISSRTFSLDYAQYFTSSAAIALTQVVTGINILISGKSLIPSGNSLPGETSTVATPLSKYQLYIPYIMENGVPPQTTGVPSKGYPASLNATGSRLIKLITGKYFI